MTKKKVAEQKPYSKQEIISLMHQQTLRIIKEAETEKRVLTMRECDMIAKLGATIERIENRVSIETTMQVFTEYNKWLCTEDIKFAQKNNSYQDKYLLSIMPK